MAFFDTITAAQVAKIADLSRRSTYDVADKAAAGKWDRGDASKIIKGLLAEGLKHTPAYELGRMSRVPSARPTQSRTDDLGYMARTELGATRRAGRKAQTHRAMADAVVVIEDEIRQEAKVSSELETLKAKLARVTAELASLRTPPKPPAPHQPTFEEAVQKATLRHLAQVAYEVVLDLATDPSFK